MNKQLLTVAMAGIILVGCGNDELGRSPADPIPAEPTEGDATVFGMGSDFGAVSFRCHGTVGVYVTVEDSKATSAIAAVPNHEAC